MRTINEISDAVRSGERITTEDAITLWREAPLWLLGELAVERKRKASGDMVYYNRNIHIEPSNICLFNCEFCSFRRREGDADAWFMSVDEVVARAEEMQGSDITEIHIVGGVHPSHSLDSYCEMIRRVKQVLPHVAVKAYTAVELFYMIRKADVTVVEGLRRLTEAGMDSIPGGGAEIFDEALRKRICPDKCSADEWLAVHRAAHHMGIHTNCTMLYGHMESIEQRVDHLNRLRELQDYAPGFDAFIPLKYRSRNNRMSEIGECSVEEDLRTIAMSRIFLDNIAHIKAYWVAYGKAITEMALAFGADDIDGTIDDSTKIYSMAGADERPTMSVAELESLVRDAGFKPVERDTLYNIVERDENGTIKGIATVGAMAGSIVGGAAAASEAVASVIEANLEAPAMEGNSADTNDSEDNKGVATIASVVATAMTTTEDNDDSTASANEDNSEMGKQTKTNGFKRFWQGLIRLYKRIPILFNIFFIGIFGFVCIVILYFALLSGTRHGEDIALPDFVDMTLDEAREIAAERGLEIVVREEVAYEEMMPGMIIAQDPAIDTDKRNGIHTVTVKPGRRIYVTIVSDNNERVQVPYVARQSLSQALQQVRAEGFIIDELIYEETDNFANQVLGQMVNGREMDENTVAIMPRGTGISLIVSYTKDNSTVIVPSVVGQPLSEARRILWSMGLNVGDVSYEMVQNKLDRRSARVCMQDVGPQMLVPYGHTISLYLSDDNEEVERMILQSEEDAKINTKWRQTEQALLRAKAEIEADIERRRVEDEQAATEQAQQRNWLQSLFGESDDNYSLPPIDESSYDEYDFFNF